MSEQIMLTISILISNRPDTVRKCLDSLKPLMEKVSSELILVDTGCGETVRDIIEEYTDKIVDFEWCRDFSKARNAGLERARGKWFLFLDDDEWFEDVTDIIRFFNSGEYAIYGVGLYTVRNYQTLDGLEYSEILASRMVRLEPDIRFIYRIHECFNRAPGKAKRLHAFVHHYGYAYRTGEERRAHALRNIPLLQEELEEHPDNMRHTLQLIQEYNCIDEVDKSLELSLQAADRADHGAVEEEHCLSSIYGNAINMYMTMYRYDEAIEKGEQYIRSSRTDKMARALIASRLAIAFVDKEKYEKALYYARLYWDTYQDYLKNENSFMDFETPVTHTCFTKRRRTPVLGNGVRAAVHCSQAALAWIWLQDMDWSLERVRIDESVIKDMIRRMPEAEEQELPYYEKMCGMLLERRDLEKVVLDTILERCGRYDDSGERLRGSAAYRNVPGEHWFLKLIRVSTAAFLPEKGLALSAEEAETAAAQVWSVMEESMPYMKAYDMPGAVTILGGDNGHVLESIPFPRWEEKTAWYFGHCTKEDAAWWTQRLTGAGQQENMHILAWRAAYGISQAAREAAAMEEENPDTAIESVMEGLAEYASCRAALCEKIYNGEILTARRDVLPEQDQGAFLISDLLEKAQEQRYPQAVEDIRRIKDLLPGLASVMKQYLKWLGGRMEQQKRESAQAAGEFRILARQIKARIYSLVEAGEYQAAFSVAEQLQMLLPEDEEIGRLREMIGEKL